jgi:GNAT superfamily N-acetyltransferase
MSERTLYLPGGEGLTVRPMRPDDADTVVTGIQALSPDSFRRRFFSPVPRLLPGVARSLTAVNDCHLTLLALDGAGRLVAMAEAFRDRRDPTSAELAVAVADAYQHQGIGPRLLRWLSRDAADAGVVRLTGSTQTDNAPAVSMFTKAGARWWFEEPGVYGFEIQLAPRDVAVPRVELGRAS